MTKNKKGFIIYADMLESINYLSDQDFGKFFRAILKFQNGENPEIPDNLKMGFEFMKSQFKRDSEKYSKVLQDRSDAGKASGIARRKKAEQKRTKRTGVQIVEQNEQTEQSGTNRTDTDTVNDTVNDKEKDNNKLPHYSNNLKTPPSPPSSGVLKDKSFEGVFSVDSLMSALDDKQKNLARKNAPNWDLYILAKVYVDGINNGIRPAPRSLKAAFPAWCAKYTKGKKL